MNPTKPSTLDEYKAWLRTEHAVENLEQHGIHYESAADQIKRSFEQHPLWTAISQGKLKGFDEQYKLQHANYGLLTHSETPVLLTKSFDSFLEKTYRINVLQNRKWPEQPTWLRQRQWILPNNWFTAINDIVRTCFVVKYFDGVKFLQGKLQEECEKIDPLYSGCHSVFQARDEGHYAAHFYVTFKSRLTSINWTPEIVTTTAELQITTQLQDVIRQMLHKHYEGRRQRSVPSDDWKWDHQSAEFATNYLGHILHYLEGMIVMTRDKQEGQR